jgi:outer membrane protein, heavy metal efflux system
MCGLVRRCCFVLFLVAVMGRTGLAQAVHVRDTIAFSYEHGAASLLDFLNAQADYRAVQLNYLNLVGSYLEAANRLNMAVGREVVP